MNRLLTTVTVLATLGALTPGCGDPDGIRSQGNISLTVHQSGQPDGTTGFSLPSDTYIDPPPGVGRGFYGTCTRVAGRWTIDLTRADAVQTGGLRHAILSAPEGVATGAVNLKLNLGASEFSGTTECTATAAPYGDKGVRFTATCTAMHAQNDLRSVDASVALTLEHCSE